MKHSRSGTSEHLLQNLLLNLPKNTQLSLFFFFFAQSSLFSAASKSIQIKCLTDDEEEENENSTVRFCMQYHAYSQLILD